MSKDTVFCAPFDFFVFEQCMTMPEWSATWQSTGIVITVTVGIFTVYKILKDIKNSKIQRDATAKLDRSKFLLEQHRRLFDNQDLKDVLQHLDGDNEVLSGEEFWEKNRKFLVFIEEIQLLINSGLLEELPCQYMFGYYANCALHGENFKNGIQFEEKHWLLFTKFASNYSKYETTFKKEIVDKIVI